MAGFFSFWFQGGPLNDTKIFIFFFSKGSDLITGLPSPFCLVGLLLDWLATAWLCPDLYWTVVYWKVFVRNFNYIKWLFFQVHRPNGRLIDMSKSILDLQRQILSICIIRIRTLAFRAVVIYLNEHLFLTFKKWADSRKDTDFIKNLEASLITFKVVLFI